MSHFTQKSRIHAINRVRELIIYYGGWQVISEKIGERPFSFKIADELGCTPKKASEYITHVINLAGVDAKLQELRKG